MSTYTTIVSVFVTHEWMNAALLSRWNQSNELRCAYFHCTTVTTANYNDWALTWVSWGMFHVGLLLAALTWSAHGEARLEERLAPLVCAICISNLSVGVHTLAAIDQPLAVVQMLVHVGILLAVLLHGSVRTGTTMGSNPPPPPIRKSTPQDSFDDRQKIQFSTITTATLCLLSAFQLLHMTFGNGREDYHQGTSNLGTLAPDDQVGFDTISNTAVTYTLWSTVILVWSVFAATSEQQQSLLKAHAIALFVAQLMLTRVPPELQSNKARAAWMGNLLSLCISLLGTF